MDAATLKVCDNDGHQRTAGHFRIFMDAATLKARKGLPPISQSPNFRIFMDAATLKENECIHDGIELYVISASLWMRPH